MITPTKKGTLKKNKNFQIQQEEKPMHPLFTNKSKKEVSFKHHMFVSVKTPKIIQDLHQYGKTLMRYTYIEAQQDIMAVLATD